MASSIAINAQSTTPTVTISPSAVRQDGTATVVVQTACRVNCGGASAVIYNQTYLGGADFIEAGTLTFGIDANLSLGAHQVTLTYEWRHPFRELRPNQLHSREPHSAASLVFGDDIP